MDHPRQATFLSDTDALLQGLQLGGVGVWRWKINTNELFWTRNLERVHRLPNGAFDGTLSSFQRDLHAEDAEAVWQKIRRSIETGEPYRAVYRTAANSNAETIWIEASGGLITAPDGSRYLTGVCFDVSEKVRSEQELERRLHQQRAVARFGSFALAETDFQKVLDEAVRIAAEVLAVPLTKILQFANSADHLILKAGIGWNHGMVGHAAVGFDRESQAGFTLLAAEPVIVADLLSETRFSGPKLLHDHGVRSGMSVTIPGTGFRPFGVFGIHSRAARTFTATDAEFLLSLANIVAGAARNAAAAEQHTLLNREMSHRAGNMLQLVTSIAGQTFRSAADMDLALSSFSARLNSLARANYVVARGGWTATRLAALVEETLQPFGNRIVTDGRDILLPPELCFDLGLVLHELATNSVKYGTLGKNEGAISIRWSFKKTDEHPKVLHLVWDDPTPTSAVPAKSANGGFGSKLMSALVEVKWNGLITTANGNHFTVSMEIPIIETRAGAAEEKNQTIGPS